MGLAKDEVQGDACGEENCGENVGLGGDAVRCLVLREAGDAVEFCGGFFVCEQADGGGDEQAGAEGVDGAVEVGDHLAAVGDGVVMECEVVGCSGEDSAE